jgi:hypothetical protein
MSIARVSLAVSILLLVTLFSGCGKKSSDLLVVRIGPGLPAVKVSASESHRNDTYQMIVSVLETTETQVDKQAKVVMTWTDGSTTEAERPVRVYSTPDGAAFKVRRIPTFWKVEGKTPASLTLNGTRYPCKEVLKDEFEARYAGAGG